MRLLREVVGSGRLDFFLAFKAYSNEEFELPTLGALARQWS